MKKYMNILFNVNAAKSPIRLRNMLNSYGSVTRLGCYPFTRTSMEEHTYYGKSIARLFGHCCSFHRRRRCNSESWSGNI